MSNSKLRGALKRKSSTAIRSAFLVKSIALTLCASVICWSIPAPAFAVSIGSTGSNPDPAEDPLYPTVSVGEFLSESDQEVYEDPALMLYPDYYNPLSPSDSDDALVIVDEHMDSYDHNSSFEIAPDHESYDAWGYDSEYYEYEDTSVKYDSHAPDDVSYSYEDLAYESPEYPEYIEDLSYVTEPYEYDSTEFYDLSYDTGYDMEIYYDTDSYDPTIITPFNPMGDFADGSDETSDSSTGVYSLVDNSAVQLELDSTLNEEILEETDATLTDTSIEASVSDSDYSSQTTADGKVSDASGHRGDSTSQEQSVGQIAANLYERVQDAHIVHYETRMIEVFGANGLSTWEDQLVEVDQKSVFNEYSGAEAIQKVLPGLNMKYLMEILAAEYEAYTFDMTGGENVTSSLASIEEYEWVFGALGLSEGFLERVLDLYLAERGEMLLDDDGNLSMDLLLEDLGCCQVSIVNGVNELEQIDWSEVNINERLIRTEADEELNFSGMNLQRVNFSGMDLRGANFSQADLRGAFFNGTNLTNANFSGADLRGAHFHDATLEGADFAGAQIEEIALLRVTGLDRDARTAGLECTVGIRLGNQCISNEPLYNYFESTIDLAGAHLFADGGGITVAIIDSGVNTSHVDLRNNVWINEAEANGLPGVDDDGNGYVDDYNGWNFVENKADTADALGHGTHVAGIVAASANGTGIVGIAPGAKIMPLKVLTGEEKTKDDVIKSFAGIPSAIYYAVNNGADVINISLAYNIMEGMLRGGVYVAENLRYWNRVWKIADAIETAIRFAQMRGTEVVVAAGNDGASFSDVGLYTLYPQVVSFTVVGATNEANQRAEFSNYNNPKYEDLQNLHVGNTRNPHFLDRGHVVSIGAPGRNILSTVSGGYDFMSGTSMAAPIITGVIALLKSLEADKTKDVLSYIYSTAKDIVIETKNGVMEMGTGGLGFGLVNAGAALAMSWFDKHPVKTAVVTTSTSTSAGSTQSVQTTQTVNTEVTKNTSNDSMIAQSYKINIDGDDADSDLEGIQLFQNSMISFTAQKPAQLQTIVSSLESDAVKSWHWELIKDGRVVQQANGKESDIPKFDVFLEGPGEQGVRLTYENNGGLEVIESGFEIIEETAVITEPEAVGDDASLQAETQEETYWDWSSSEGEDAHSPEPEEPTIDMFGVSKTYEHEMIDGEAVAETMDSYIEYSSDEYAEHYGNTENEEVSSSDYMYEDEYMMTYESMDAFEGEYV